MPIWIRKSLVVLISILTFGLITPTQISFIENGNANKLPKNDALEEKVINPSYQEQERYSTEEKINKEVILSQIFQQAEDQSYLKFGEKIKPVIHDEFKEIIFPNIESAIKEAVAEFPERDLKYLAVSEIPGKGNAERIFHITDMKKNQDIMRFHVRRDHPPQQGYWYNFHYHTYHDAFETHHELGSIYWGKNTPPKWMS
ncbi:YpjP family protein [Bacillus massilinigeriensis]|uniref:YpjP family protein n=1 Tax=Bacillus massilionigeriensis TaxID=1805475 RepID=UPI00096B263B|nr:YpjP family protein [Bacillus massilionigeriensis]